MSAGSGTICDCDIGVGVGICEGEKEECMGLGGVRGFRDGRGEVVSLRDTRQRRPAGRRRRIESSVGLLANIVMERRRGKTRMSHAVGKWIGGKRVIRAEWRAIEHLG